MHIPLKDIVLFFVVLILASGNEFVHAKDWYVRPAGGNYGRADGTSYDDAWNGLLQVKWGMNGVSPGDNLYVCGTHVHDMINRGNVASQAELHLISGAGDSARIITRGDCPGDPECF